MRARKLGAPLCAAALVCALSSAALAQESENDWAFDEAQPNDQPPTAPPPAQQNTVAPTEATPEPLPAPLQVRGDDPTADHAGASVERSDKQPVEKRILHGFRMGYLYVANYDKEVESDDPDCAGEKCSLKERYGMRTPHQYLLGYEIMGRLIGHGWLNVVVVGNVLVSGLEQSKFWPSANLLIGFEFDESFQVGLGPNFTLEEDKPAHLVLAGGWTPKIGSFYVPVHGFFIPDVDGNHRMGATVGVNW